LVTANYKLSFDHVRRAMDGLDAWVLVLDTKGVNVWCAAGKGTFGTEELIRRLDLCQVAAVVEHKTVVVPQLGAPGVAAHEVSRRSGFRVVYGPVRACDLPAFLRAGMRATPEMRRVRFTLPDRLVLTPNELARLFLPAVIVLACFVAAAGLGRHGYRLTREQALWAASAVGVNYLAGIDACAAAVAAGTGVRGQGRDRWCGCRGGACLVRAVRLARRFVGGTAQRGGLFVLGPAVHRLHDLHVGFRGPPRIELGVAGARRVRSRGPCGVDRGEVRLSGTLNAERSTPNAQVQGD
jgi:hypothetical protein